MPILPAGTLVAATTLATVTPEQLIEVGSVAHPSRISAGSKELSLLRDYLLAVNAPEGSGAARRASAWLLLDLLRHGVSADDEASVREAFYNRRIPGGSPYPVSGSTIDRWMAFQANELCHIAFEAILNAILTDLQNHPLGMDPNLLLENLLGPPLEKLGATGQTWQEWATVTGVNFVGSEETLVDPILSALSNVELASNPDCLINALQLTATLWLRWGGEDTSVCDTIERHAGNGGRSLSGVLRTLNAAQYIHAHASEVIHLDDLVAASGVSPRSLHSGFKKYYGVSPMSYLRNVRLDLARLRFKAEGVAETSVTDVALSCGFTHLSKRYSRMLVMR